MGDQPVIKVAAMGFREGAARATTLTVRRAAVGTMKTALDAHPDVYEDLPPARIKLLAPLLGTEPWRPKLGKWALVVNEEDRASAVSALAALIEHRRTREELWNDGIIAVPPSLSGTPESWLRRFGNAAGTPPHFLLFVGGPDRLPFDLQFELDRERITGRLDASDTPGGPFSWDACRRYAQKVIDYESDRLQLSRKPLFYSVNNEENTEIAHELLTLPLAKRVSGGVVPLYGADATVDKLSAALEQSAPPRLVFMVSHGIEYPRDPSRWGALTEYVSRGRESDPVISAQLFGKPEQALGWGSIFFSFACFSAGVPDYSTVGFLYDEAAEVTRLTPQVSALGRQLLGHPRGPVAFVGHIGGVTQLAFSKLFSTDGIAPYQEFIGWLKAPDGTIGWALDSLRQCMLRCGRDVASVLNQAVKEQTANAEIRKAGAQFVAFHDFRGFMLLGDPILSPR